MAAATLGGYELIERLAVGGMAEVFLAHKDGERVAVKRILPHLVEKPDFVAMFQEEMRLFARLDHPHVVKLRDFGHDGDTWYLAMEYVAGADLSSVVRRSRQLGAPLPPADVAAILIAACEALEHAHARGIVHRDVTPSNLLVGYDGAVKLADFGIATAGADEDDAVKGKRAYMSPEQAAGGAIDVRSDVFSLGVCGSELLAGDSPARLEAIVLRAMASAPETRFASAGALRAALRDWLLASGESPNLPSTMLRLFGADAKERARRARMPSEPTRIARTPSRWKTKLALALCAGILIGFMLRSPAPAPPARSAVRMPARALPPPPVRRRARIRGRL
jgi:serine/threonine-protein kinase